MSVPSWSSAAVEAALYRAGMTLLAKREDGCWPAGYRSCMPVEAIAAYGGADNRLRAAAPSAAEISAMDQACSWLGLLPGDSGGVVLRRLVGSRMLVDPLSGRNLYSWRRLGEVMGIHHSTVKSWWMEACELIARALNRPGLCHAIKAADLRPVVRSWKAVGAAAAAIERELA